MNNSRKYIILIACLLAIGLSSVAQQVRPVYPVKPLTQEDISRRQRIPEWGTNTRSASSAVLPEGVDNSTLKYFPPVFSQLGNSCSQASGVRYVYTYELNRLLDRAADSPEHIFNYHFTWNYLNEGNDQGSHPELGYNMMKVAGAVTLSDMNDESAATSSTTWMTGYDKYLRAMNYRVKSYSKFTLKTREGIDRLRQYLYNRGEEGEPGGVVTFSCKSSDWKEVTYKGTSVTGLTHMITRPGTDGAHALTIAGYDDTVAYDLNGDGEITEDERGAFIVVNSWGTWWGSEGKCYYPYKYFLLPAAEGGLADLDAEALMVEPEIHTPLVIFRVKLTYTSRNDLYFRLGVAEGDAVSPSVILDYPLMLTQGGDYYMQGNGTLESFKTIEVGLNFTDKLADFQSFRSPKYFLIVRQIGNGKLGEGKINSFSVNDYRTGTEYACTEKDLPIKGELKLSTSSTIESGLSASPVEWLVPDTNTPQSHPFVVRKANGQTVKLQFQGYDRKNGKLTIRYAPLP